MRARKRTLVGLVWVLIVSVASCFSTKNVIVDGGTGSAGRDGGVSGTGGRSASGGGSGATGSVGGVGSGGMTGTGGAGTGGVATGGTGTGGASTGGASTGGRGTGGAGTGGAGTGGAGTGGVGTGGAASGGRGTGGAGTGGVGTGGVGTGGAGTGGAGTGGSGTGGANPLAVAAILDGQAWVVPCGATIGTRDCANNAPMITPPVPASDPLAGCVNRNDIAAFGGQSGTLYQVTVRVRGLVEAKSYVGGTEKSDLGTDGWYIGGGPDPSTAGEDTSVFNAYALRVGSPSQLFFLNSIGIPGDNRIRASTFRVDYLASFLIYGGSPLQFMAADRNCIASRNCDDSVISTCTAQSISNLPPVNNPPGTTITQPLNGQFLVMTVMSVTQM